ncbi:MAG: PAS domain-containing protein, partial [Rickettsiales bacterium]
METTLNQTNTPVSSAFLETYFSTLAENCPLAIAQLDKTGQIIKANSGFVALLGKEQFSAIADHAFADYLRDDSKPILARLLEEGLRGE